MASGSFVLVLHGHLPYVLKHGNWPHGEQWLFEAAAETWLPMLQVIDEVQSAGSRFAISLGLTPVLLEQLVSPRFKEGFVTWLTERQERAVRDAEEFRGWGDQEMVGLAERWRAHYQALIEQFEALNRDIPAAFSRLWEQGVLELMSSCATHGYLPLLREDASSFAQVRTGLDTSERILGRRPKGFWLPECAYRPAGQWKPPVLDGSAIQRRGVDQILRREGVGWFVVDAALYRGGRSEGVVENGRFRKVGWDQASWDDGRAWRSVMEPHAVSSVGEPTELVAFARHPEVSEQVWSSQVGYPGDGRYLEFHKKHRDNGLRYWRVTSPKAGLGDKARYQPDQVEGAVYSHAQHFCAVVRSQLKRHREETGRHGVVVAPFDAELFGHWWHEGPQWLKNVLLTLGADPEVDVQTGSEVLASHPADKVIWLPEGSWGAGSDHRVWFNDTLRWTWEVVHRNEQRFGQLLHTMDWESNDALRQVLEAAGREQLLLQASDWQFVIHTDGAPDYGYKRFCGHASRFDRLCDMAWDLSQGRALDATQQAVLAEALASDSLFPHLDLNAWSI